MPCDHIDSVSWLDRPVDRAEHMLGDVFRPPHEPYIRSPDADLADGISPARTLRDNQLHALQIVLFSPSLTHNRHGHLGNCQPFLFSGERRAFLSMSGNVMWRIHDMRQILLFEKLPILR